MIGMKVAEVENGETIDGLLKIIVYMHKTGKIKPAVVFLEKKATQAYKMFLEKILPQIDKENDHFFISFKGKKITHEGVKMSLNS